MVVCGGGIAGLSAATELCERGVRVTLLEAERFLGGRAGGWNDRLADGSSFQMERGFHAFFRQYYNLRALIMRVDPALSLLEPQTDYPVIGPLGAVETFAALPRRTPLNVLELVRRTETLKVTDLMRVSPMRAGAMLSYGPHTYARWDATSAEAYLDSLRFPGPARQMLFEVFSHSFFNLESELSAAELLMQFHFYFTGNPEGLVFDTMKVPFGRGFFEPLGRYLETRGADVRLGERVDAIEQQGERFVVHGGTTHVCDAVVLALHVPGLRRVVESSQSLGDREWREDIARLDVTRPFVVWRIWLDRPVRTDRAPFVGTVGLGILDNVSVYERLEDESAHWAATRGGSVLELHAYAIDPAREEADLKAELLVGLHALYAETRGARIVEERFLRRDDCPSFAPGSYARRPTVSTPTRGLMLAGDFVKLDIPSALMERAAASGKCAAQALCGEEASLPSVARRGVLAGLRL